jgi:hypothetical protein
MSDIDQQNRHDPSPIRRFIIQYPKPPTDRKQQQRHSRAPEKDRKVNISGKQPESLIG